MAKYKVQKKFTVLEGWGTEIKTFESERDAKDYAATLNEAYQSGIKFAVDNPSKAEKEVATQVESY